MAEDLGLGSCEYNLVNVEETDESGKSLADQQALSAT
jgi:hypothetical protein